MEKKERKGKNTMKFMTKYRFLNFFVWNRLLIISVLYFLFGCKPTKEADDFNRVSNQEYSIKAVLWQQLSGEYKALAFQAFNFAKYQLDILLNEESLEKKPLAIVTDIDETILNNSPFLGKLIALDERFSKKRWVEWGLEESADPIPGALDFFRYAESRNVEIFYISNRYDIQLNETLENMKKIGFPYSDKEHILLKKNMSGKEPRRMKIEKTHKIIMLLGDNLSDFSSVFDNCSTKKRNGFVDSLRTSFGKKFIVIPNPTYGSWETDGLYEKKHSWTSVEKDSIRKFKLKSY